MRRASSGGLPRPYRWPVWAAAGVVAGLATGFGLGLARPRPKAD